MLWKQRNTDERFTMFQQYGYSELAAVTFCNAGLKTVDEAKEFLEGNTLHDPSKIRGIDKAADIIWDHIYRKNMICIFGDYDTDGVTASAVMYLGLERLGANVRVRLPDRIEEGYGISEKAIMEQIELGVKLFVTVDNGVRAIEEAKLIKKNGCDIVIFDHHEPGDVLPEADSLIDLHIPGETYPNIELTGAGLAWKVIHYMLEQIGEHDYALSLIDLAAIGTIGDVAPLIGENRVIVKRALKLMRSEQYARQGVIAIMKDMRHITAEDIAFKLSPCINASGRLNRRGAELPLIALLETRADEAERLARQIVIINEKRKKIQQDAFQAIIPEAEKRIAEGDKVIVLCAPDTPSGVAGLLSGNLKEEFNRPAIVFAPKQNVEGKTVWTGSARSVEGFHILNAIESCKDLLLGYGGHMMAAGLTIEADEEALERFRVAINAYASNLSADPERVLLWDLEVLYDMLDNSFFSEMEKLEPFGAGVPKPLIKTTAELNKDTAYKISSEKHVRLYTSRYDMVGFFLAQKYLNEELPERVTVIGSLSMNYFFGDGKPEVKMTDFVAA